MWCPACQTEYRAGFTTCADCGAALQEGEPTAPRPEPAREPTIEPATAQPGWTRIETILDAPADPESELAVLTGRLAEAGIPFQVEDDVESRATRRAGLTVRHPLPWFHVSVPEEHREEGARIAEEERHAAREAAHEAYGGEGPAPVPESKSAPNGEPQSGFGGSVVALIVIVVATVVLVLVFGR